MTKKKKRVVKRNQMFTKVTLNYKIEMNLEFYYWIILYKRCKDMKNESILL